MDIFELSPREFRAFLEEERQYRTPEQIDDLMRRYNQANSLSGRLSGLLAPQEGRRRATFFPASVPEGMSLFDAFRAGEAELAVPQGIVDMVVGGVQGVENPGLAAQGRIPAADMETAALQTAGTAMLGGGVAAKPAGALGAFYGREGGSIQDALELARSGRGIFHSSQADQFDEINRYGVEPQYGPWVKEIAEGAIDDPSFLDDMPMAAWWSEQPDWVKMKTARAAGKSVNNVTVDDIRKYGHLSIADADEYADTVYRIPEEGIDYEGSEVSNLSGERMPLYATDLYEYGDDGVGRYPFGIERNELVTRESVEPKYSLTGQELVDFLEQYDGNTVSANASKSAGLLSVASDVSARGDQILNMLKSGRGSEVTDAMLDMGDSVKNTQLNQYLAANYDLPMDEASRLARAREMGFEGGLFHGTDADIMALDKAKFGLGENLLGKGFYTTGNPKRANIYVPIGNPKLPKGVFQTGNSDFTQGGNILPLMTRSATEFDATQSTGKSNALSIGKAFEGSDFDVEIRDNGDQVFIKSKTNPDLSVYIDSYQDGMVTLQKLKDVFGRENVTNILEEAGFSGLKAPESSGSVTRVNYNPQDVRTQFARFDPRLSHLSNVTAANASKGTGAMTLWHGSPYDFNEFDLSKIGTGEGAQDLGRGFSLTDYEANAHLYTNPASRWGDLAAMERYRQAGPGRYYQVNVGAAPEQFLDWNKPWRDQVPEATPLYDALAKEEAVMLSQYADDPAMQAAIPRGKVSNMWRDNAGLEDAALQSGFVGNSRRNYSGDTEYTVFDPSLLRIDQKFDADGNVVSANASPISGLLAQSGVSSEQAQRIEDYLYRTGLLQ